MKKIFSTHDIPLISFYKSILDDNGIECVIKNYYLTGAAGQLPPNECLPELWIIDDSKVAEAKALLSEQINTSWKCGCGEEIAGQFAQCWKCGKLRE